MIRRLALRIQPTLLLLIGFTHATNLAALESITTPDSIEISITQHPAEGAALVIWFPSEAGPQQQDATIADALASSGIEVWRTDLLEARFLPLAESSLDQVPASDVQALIEAAQAHSDKRIYLIANGRAAIPVLSGARAWQLAHPTALALGGIVMLSPKLFVETPDPGEAAKLMPVVTASNVAIYWLQPKLSPWFWQLPKALRGLEQGGAAVFVRTLPGLRDRFFYRPDASAEENAMAAKLATLLAQGIDHMNRLPSEERAASLEVLAAPPVAQGKKDRMLKPYGADPVPPALNLPDLQDRAVDLKALRGKVVLINFWATWCPPCVKEMPSMQALYERLADQPFEILAVNMAETPEQVQAFIKDDVQVSFPILMDSDGAALTTWSVFAFPTSFVIDKAGHIRYALFGSIDWDQADVLMKIQQLLGEAPPRP